MVTTSRHWRACQAKARRKGGTASLLKALTAMFWKPFLAVGLLDAVNSIGLRSLHSLCSHVLLQLFLRVNNDVHFQARAAAATRSAAHVLLTRLHHAQGARLRVRGGHRALHPGLAGHRQPHPVQQHAHRHADAHRLLLANLQEGAPRSNYLSRHLYLQLGCSTSAATEPFRPPLTVTKNYGNFCKQLVIILSSPLVLRRIL